MQRMITTDSVNLFYKPIAGSKAVALLAEGTPVEADDQYIDDNTKHGDFRFRRVKAGRMSGYVLEIYLTADAKGARASAPEPAGKKTGDDED